jgi:hypothetical protein
MRKKFKSGTKKPGPTIQQRQAEFRKFIKSYKNKPLDEAAVRKGYKILTKKFGPGN